MAYHSKINLTKGVIMDACAAADVEALCDKAQEEIGTKAIGADYYVKDARESVKVVQIVFNKQIKKYKVHCFVILTADFIFCYLMP